MPASAGCWLVGPGFTARSIPRRRPHPMDGRRRHLNPLKANGGAAEDRWSRGGGVVRRWHRDLSHRKDTAVLLPRAGSPLRRELRWVLPRKLGSLWWRKFHLAFSRSDVSIKAEQCVADSSESHVSSLRCCELLGRVHSVGPWHSCMGFWCTCRYIDGYAGSIDTSAAAGIGRQVAVQHHKRLGKCVLAEDLRPSQWCRDTARCQTPSMAGIRGTNFVVPANSHKIIVALYGWDWQIKDPQKRGGGGYAGGGGDVCAWPNRPDGSVREAVRAGAGAILDGGGGENLQGEAGDAALFASVLSRAGKGSRQHSARQGGRGEGSGHKEKRPPPTREQMTSILLG